jgi:hypothetical protein
MTPAPPFYVLTIIAYQFYALLGLFLLALLRSRASRYGDLSHE